MLNLQQSLLHLVCLYPSLQQSLCGGGYVCVDVWGGLTKLYHALVSYRIKNMVACYVCSSSFRTCMHPSLHQSICYVCVWGCERRRGIDQAIPFTCFYTVSWPCLRAISAAVPSAPCLSGSIPTSITMCGWVCICGCLGGNWLSYTMHWFLTVSWIWLRAMSAAVPSALACIHPCINRYVMCVCGDVKGVGGLTKLYHSLVSIPYRDPVCVLCLQQSLLRLVCLYSFLH